MADQITNSTGYDAGNVGSGVGAAVFAAPHRDLSDINAAWNLQNKQDEDAAAEEAKQKAINAKALIADLNPDAKGALDSDADYFRNGISNILTQKQELYKEHQGNPTTPEALLRHQNILGQQVLLKNEAEQSANHKNLLLKATAALDADKAGLLDKEATVKNMAMIRATPISDRQKVLDKMGGDVLVQAPLNASAELYKDIKGLHPDQTANLERVDSAGNKFTETNSGWSEKQLELAAKNSYKYNPRVQKAFNQNYEQLERVNPSKFQAINTQAEQINQKAIQEGRPQDVIAPQQLLAVEDSQQYAFNKQVAKQNREPEAEKYAWWKRRQEWKRDNPDSKDDPWDYDRGLDAVNGNKKGFASIQTDPQTGGVLGNGSVLDGRLADATKVIVDDGIGGKKTLPNTVIATQGVYDKDGSFLGTKVVTDADIIKAGQDPLKVTKEQLYQNMDAYGASLLTREKLDVIARANKFKLNISKRYKTGGQSSNFNTQDIAPTTNQSIPSEQTAPLSNKGTVGNFQTVAPKEQVTHKEALADTYNAQQEAGIKKVMDHNKISRDEAIKALKDAKKL